jgi:16S rRNA (adenine1518-N6/adenine1519-N6)-dimethyltransferase
MRAVYLRLPLLLNPCAIAAEVYKAKKNLSQNFLNDQVVLKKISDFVNPDLRDNFLEIGPGRGSLTKILCPDVESLDAVELDKDLLSELKRLEESQNSLKIHNANILDFDLSLLTEQNNLRVIGNLPYNISSSIVLWSLEHIDNFQDMHYMFQKEFGQRLFANPKTKSYGRLSILSQFMAQITYLFTIHPESFNPQPSVESVFIKITPIKGRDMNSPLAKKLQEITQITFSKRRKMLSKSLKGILQQRDFLELEIDSSDRPEDLSVEDFIKLSNFLLEG